MAMTNKNIYGITVKEILSRTVAVKANSLEDAIDLVQEAYDTEKIVLDYKDFDEYEINASPYARIGGIITKEDAEDYEKLNFKGDEDMNDKELWKQAQKKAEEEYEEEFGGGSWEEADKYEKEDYVWAAYTKLKGE